MSTARALSEQEILQGFMTLQTKIDGLGQQVFNSSMLLEYLIERINAAVSTDKISDLNVDLEEFQEFYETRLVELQEQWKKAVQAQVHSGGPTDAGSGPVIDLGE